MKKIVIFVLTFLITIFMSMNLICAQTTVNATLNSNNVDLKSGQEVEITFKLDNYNDVKKGINAYKATLEYDTNIFEEVIEDSFECLNGWEGLLYNPLNKQFVSIKKYGSIEEENVVKIKLKVKEDVKSSKTYIKVSDIVVSEGKKDIFVDEKSISLNIIKEQTIIPTNSNSNNNTIDKDIKDNSIIDSEQEPENNSDEEIYDKTDNENNKEEDKKIKKTSTKYFGLFLLLFLQVLIIFLILFIRKKRKEEEEENKKENINKFKNKKKYMIFFIVLILSFEFIGTTCKALYDFSKKGELNNDNVVNYYDVNLLESHLISLNLLPTNKYENADINSDGKITVTDLTLLIQKIEDALDYEVSLTNTYYENYYPNKNDEIDLSFNGEASYGLIIEKVTINGNEYNVIKKDDTSNEYSVKVKVPNQDGIYEYKFSEVSLNNGKKVKIDYKVKIDVLKDKPSIDNYIVKEDITDANNYKLNISFDLNDIDDSVTSGTIVVKNDKSEIVIANHITNGKNNIQVPVEEGKHYKVYIDINYDLDSNELENDKDHKETLSIEKDLVLVTKYDFTISNINTYKNDVKVNSFEKLEKIDVGFESTNSSEYEPTNVKIDGKTYEIIKKNKLYFVTIDGISDLGSKKITIEEVILSNGKKFILEKDNQIEINIIKRRPDISKFEITENVTESSLNVNFDLIDEDDAINKLEIIVYDDKGTKISSEILSNNEIKSGKINKSLVTDITSKYNVKVIANYNQDDREVEVTLLEQEVIALPNSKITNVVTNKKYIEKEGIVTLTYTIVSNKNNDITRILVNNNDCTAQKQENGKYKVTYQVDNKSGVTDLVTTKLTYSDNLVVDVNNSIKVEVLKDKPSIANFEQKDNINNSSVTLNFDVVDLDNSFISGNAILTNTKDGTSTIKELNKGHNILTFDVNEAQLYSLEIKTTYDLDIDGSKNSNNYVENDLIITKEIELLVDYKLEVNNVKTYNDENESKYFKKDKAITLTFESTNITDFKPVKVIINKKEYNLEYTNGRYKTIIDSYDSFGSKEIVIETIILDNTKHVVLDGSDKIKIEILKDKPSVKNFTYEETEDGKIKIIFDVIDNDNSITSGNVVIKDENNKNIVNESISVGENSLTFTTNSSDNYIARISTDYDLDTNTLDNDSNTYSKVLLEEEISSLTNVIELKDVISTELYDSNNSKINVLDITSGIPTNLDNYYVKINMKNLPTYYASVKSIKKNGNKLNITINQTHFIMYKVNGDGYSKINNYTFEIPYKDEKGEQTLVKTANELFSEIGKNPNGNYTLTEDLDASSVTSNPAIPYTFKGTLDGNGHKIINLSSALFNELNGATIENLIIEDAKITNNSKGIIANTITNNSIIQNVHIKDSSLNNNQYPAGGFTGMITGSTVKESSAININISAYNTVGGIAGNMGSGSIIENCYVTGTIKGTHNHATLGARVGGITGWHAGNKIDHCYTNVTIKVPKDLGGGGLIGGSSNNPHPVIKNSVSFGSGNGYRISGFNNLNNMSNVYEYSKSEQKTNILENTTTIKSITDIYDKNFYKETLGFDENIWNLNLLEHNKLPNLKNDSMPNEIDKYEILENKNNIPNYGEVRYNNSYNKNNEIAYYNLSKLMPFENTKNWVKMGNSISNDSLLNKTKIKFILPLDDKDKLIISLGRTNANKIKKIRVIYTNDKTEEFNVTYKLTIENLVAVYKIKGSKLEYQYDNYLTNIDEELLNNATKIANDLDYSSKIATITSENESRLYVDFYNENVKENIKDIIYNYISNDNDIPTYSDNNIVKSFLNSNLSEDELIRLLYAYNYYEKWYRIDLDGVKISDLMFFNGKKLNNTMTTTYMINSVINTNSNNRATNKTVNFYNAFINGKVGKSLPDYLAYLFKTVNGYNDPSDWLVNHFDGLIYEQPAISPISDQITYRIWPIMTGASRNMHMLLPILSAPQEDMYLISCPSQYIIGSLNRYSTYLNKDGKERDRMLDLMKNYGTNLGLFYGVSSSFIPNASNRINNIINVQFDTRFNFPASNKADGGTQSSGTTKDPVMKWVYEAVGNAWGAANGSGAYADGDNVWWIVDAALGYNRAVHVFTHETAHNQDNRYFYSGNGRRPNTGAEAHADGVISQDISTYTTVFNLTKKFALDSDYTTNLSYERINSADKIHSYYREMYETKYVLEYLAAQAFLKLTPEEQANVSVQLQHNTGVNYTTNYVRLTANQIKEMNLKTVEDLWDNKLAIRGTGSSAHTWTGSYGHDSFYNLYFYIPNNPDGTPDTNTFKNTGYEMLGYAGYDKGFITYMSGRSANDLAAIRKITNDDTMTWKKYKMSRYNNVRDNLSKVNYYDIDALIELYKRAFEVDAKKGNLNVSQAVTKLYYGIVKRATNDFSTGGIYTKDSQISITSSEQFINLLNSNTTGNYRIDADLDFSNINSIDGNNYYVLKKFIGTIDGNGHKLTGVKYTLFKEMAYAGIKNLTIERPTYIDSSTASIALTGNSFDLYNVKINNSNLKVQHVSNKSGMYFSSDTNTITTRSTEINSVEDLLQIGKSSSGLSKSYVLTNDIDLSSLDRTGNPIISGSFSGSIEGNNHQISNAKDVLFGSVTGTIKNIKIENANITSNNAKGIFSNSISNATIEGISINNSSIVNSASLVGGLTGEIKSSKVNKISLTGVTVKADNTLGGLAGQITSGTVENILFTGKVLGTTTSIYNLGSRAGGITGWLSSNAAIKYAITSAEINGYEKKGNGGIIGGPNSGNVNIINSISLSTGTNAYRIAGYNVLNKVSNVYEYSLSNSATNINENNNSKVLLATIDDIKKLSFYTDSVKLDSDIWDFDDVSSGGLPKLIDVTSSDAQIKNLFKDLETTQNTNDVVTDNNMEKSNSNEEENSQTIIEDTSNENSEAIIENTTNENDETVIENSSNENSETTLEETSNEDSESVIEGINNENNDSINNDTNEENSETITENNVNENDESVIENSNNETTLEETSNKDSESVTEKTNNKEDKTTTSSENITNEVKNINEETTSNESETSEIQEVILEPDSGINNNLIE